MDGGLWGFSLFCLLGFWASSFLALYLFCLVISCCGCSSGFWVTVRAESVYALLLIALCVLTPKGHSYHIPIHKEQMGCALTQVAPRSTKSACSIAAPLWYNFQSSVSLQISFISFMVWHHILSAILFVPFVFF